MSGHHSYAGRIGINRPRKKTSLRDHQHHQRLQGPKPKAMPHKRGPKSFAGTYLDPRKGL